MNNPLSYFSFSSKSLTSAALVCFIGFILAFKNPAVGFGFVLGALTMLIVSAYAPSHSSKTMAQHVLQDTPKDNPTNEPLKTIFVGNLAFKANKYELGKLFSEHGYVHSVRLMTDRATHKPRGFGFVEMNVQDAQAAIAALDEYEFYGRQLRVNEANERKPRNEEA